MIRNIKIYPGFMAIGRETVQVKVVTEKGEYSASVPSGTSKGVHEAKEFKTARSLEVFRGIRHHFINRDETDWRSIDELLLRLDGTQNFSKIGMNLAVGISVAVARAATDNQLWRLNNPELRKGVFPYPLGNIIGGGKHGGGTDWQEFLLLNHSAKDPQRAVETMIEVWSSVGDELRKKKVLEGMNLESAWMTSMDDFKTLDFLSQVAEDWNIRMGMDFAASSFWDGKHYVYRKSGKELTTEQHFDLIEEIAGKYKIYFLEDPFHEEDYASFVELTKSLGKKHMIVGDDLYVTSPERFASGVEQLASNGIIVKPNQVGTLLQSQKVVDMAHENNIAVIPSHRSGETTDPWLADLSVAWRAHIIKISSAGVDMAKHNRLIELWNEIPHVEMAELP
jgi:enolase